MYSVDEKIYFNFFLCDVITREFPFIIICNSCLYRRKKHLSQHRPKN